MAELSVRGDGWHLVRAGPQHNEALCELFASVHLKSALDLTQERDPDFFMLPRMHQGSAAATAVGLDDEGRVVGCGTVIVRDGWFDGRRVTSGYLCDLRVAPGFRGGLHLARGYGEFMAWISRELGAELFTTVIFDSNRAALRALTERSDKRREQPVYRPMTPFEMVSVQFTTKRAAPGAHVRSATAADRERLVAFLAERARARVLGEVLTAERFDERLALWPGFALEDFLIAERGARIVGCLAPWDTGAFKRTRVLGYHGRMAWQRRLFDLGARLRGFSPLPRPGACFRFAFLTHLEIEGDDPAILRELLLAAYARLRPRGLHFMSAFVARGSPLAAAFSGFFTTRTAMTLYAVHPPESRWASVELATLHPGFEMALS